MNPLVTTNSEPLALNAEQRALDRSCTDSGCGCTSASTSDSTPDGDKARRKTLSRAGIVGLLCVLGCAAGPLAIGGVAAVAGTVAGEAWVIAAGLLIAATFYAYRRRTGPRTGRRAGRRGC